MWGLSSGSAPTLNPSPIKREGLFSRWMGFVRSHAVAHPHCDSTTEYTEGTDGNLNRKGKAGEKPNISESCRGDPVGRPFASLPSVETRY